MHGNYCCGLVEYTFMNYIFLACLTVNMLVRTVKFSTIAGNPSLSIMLSENIKQSYKKFIGQMDLNICMKHS